MPYTKAGYEAAKKYKAKNIKRIPLDVQISEYEDIKSAAESVGEKVNEYIRKAVRDRIERNS